METTRPAVREALTVGEVSLEQARVIVLALDALPADLDPETVVLAEETLVAHAADHDPRGLRVLGRRVLEVIDPAAGEAEEARQLEAEERAANQACRFTMSEDGHGKTHGRFTLPTAQGQMLRKQLHAIAAPQHQTATHGHQPERRASAERMGHAFAEWVETYPTDRLPTAGGLNATVVVTIPVQTLTGGLAAGQLDTGGHISPGQARRIACGAGIIPAVLGTDSVVLDLGRRTRFHTAAQRTAIALRDGGCTAEGCDTPPSRCHTHHDQPWSHGGTTTVTTGRLLCPRHHHHIHDPTYQTTRLPTGKLRFHRRT